MQQETPAATSALQTQAARVGDFRKQDADSAHTTELSQRQIRRSLASAGEGFCLKQGHCWKSWLPIILTALN